MPRSARAEDSALKNLFVERLKLSSLDNKTSKKLRLDLRTAAQAPKELTERAAGFVIPYFDLSGKETGFYRYRMLEQPKRIGFAATTEQKPRRYIQPPNTLNELYLPSIVDWKQVATDTSIPIAITEGEMKSACGTLRTEVPTIGLGGVWCWKSTKTHRPMLDGFAEIDWRGRDVYIVYDSDAITNPKVVQAENALARALTDLGALVRVVRLPPLPDGNKCGLDDYLLHNEPEELQALYESSSVWISAKELHELNEEVVYVQNPGFVVRMDTLQKMAPNAFVSHHYAPRSFYEEQVSATGKISTVRKSAPAEWLKWPARAEVQELTYRPGEPRIVSGALNTWPGWAVQPKKGDVSLWNELLDHLFQGHPEERKWLEQWLAWPLQHPGEKLYTYVLVWGLRHGTGKSLIGYSMKQIYGKNWTEIKDSHLANGRNEWAENKQFVMGDELMIGDKRGMNDRVKGMITQEEMRIDIKFIPSYVVPDIINYYFTSNHPDSFFLEDDDRRAWIYEVTCGPMPDEFYARYERWMRADKYPGAEGPSALFHHLLSIDTTGFNPRARAPLTAAKTDMLESGRSDLGAWVAQLRIDPDSVLRLGDHVIGHKLWRAEDLRLLYDPDDTKRVTANGLARELRRQGFQRVADGMSVPTKSVGQARLWIIRPLEVEGISQMDAARLYDSERGYDSAKKSRVRAR